MSSTLTFAQKDSKGDFYFFEYAYKDAIREYNKESIKKNLTKQQYLNLADSYLKTGNFKKASELYIDSYAKDSLLANTYINKLLLSIGKTDGLEKVKYYLSKSSSFLSKELLENADFNFELIENNQNSNLDFYVFNCYLNSPQSDFSPAFYKDELLFTSGRQKGDKKGIYKPSGESYLDIYSGTIQADGDITIPKIFTKIPSSNFHKATPFYAQDLNNIIYMLSNADDGELLFDKNGKNTLAIGSVNEKGKFQYLLRDLSTSFYYPFYEAKTGRLYFAANFENGYGGTDIYYVNTNSGQIMSAPTNLGPRINTPGNEIAPFVFDGSLYFSSDIFYGLGGMDIYTSNFQSDGSFSIPVNLGKGINSVSDDFGFIIKKDKAEGLLGYFSSNREGGKGNDDIYGFKVSDKPGLKTLVIKGTVANPVKGNSIDNVVVNILDSNNQVLKQVVTDQNGNYQFEIPFRSTYTITASKKGHGNFSKSFTVNEEANQIQNLTINLPYIQDIVEEKENKTVLKLKKFYFTAGANIISPEIVAELDKVVAIVGNFPKIKLKIETHTNSRGSNTANLALSQSRSDAIKKYLLNKGVSKDNIINVVGYGETKLVNQCKDGVFCLEFLHNQNERTLISVLNYDELIE
tara:strand:- start:1353 stop:3251 length:1899 start_codon:yes stop_codon:yes gene_type:complete